MVGTKLVGRVAAIFALGSLWPACGGPGSAVVQDAGSEDGSSASSSGGAAPPGDASDNATDADAAPSADGGPLVAECQALAMTFANTCYDEYTGDTLTPDTERVCIWQAYAHLCQTGRTQLLLDSMMCFGQNPSCWTFSDSNDAATCLNNVHAASPPSPALVAFANQYCGACNTGGGCADAGASLSGAGAELFPYMTDAQLSQTSSCLADASCNASLPSACTAVPELAIFSCH
jgi:hypothetical protein